MGGWEIGERKEKGECAKGRMRFGGVGAACLHARLRTGARVNRQTSTDRRVEDDDGVGGAIVEGAMPGVEE